QLSQHIISHYYIVHGCVSEDAKRGHLSPLTLFGRASNYRQAAGPISELGVLLGLEDVGFLGDDRLSTRHPMLISLRLSEITSRFPSTRSIHHVKPSGEDGAVRGECPD